jgi:putative peptidoglycan lipid II flippase
MARVETPETVRDLGPLEGGQAEADADNSTDKQRAVRNGELVSGSPGSLENPPEDNTPSAQAAPTSQNDAQLAEAAASSAETDSVPLPGAGVFPLEIEHNIEVSPEEAMATGWPGAAATDGAGGEAPAFPVEMSEARHFPIREDEASAWPEQLPGDHPGAVVSTAQPDFHVEQRPPENGEVRARAALPPQRPEEIIGAIELAPHPESPGEIIGPIELAHFFAETTADPASLVEPSPATAVETAPPAHTTERRHLVKSAALVSIGNLGSSLLGMVRQIVVTSQGNAIAAPFNAALAPVNNFYQLLVNGSTDGALIPVFNDYASPERRLEMRRVVFTVVNLILIIAVIASLGYLLISPWFVDALVSGYQGADKALTLQYSQIIFFSLVVLGPFAVLLAALFSLKAFGWPAFATASYHAGIILGALVFMVVGSYAWGPIVLPIGLLIGAAGQIALLLPGIRSHKLYYMFVLDLKHPALKRIYRLYWPIAVSYVFSMGLVFLDLHLQSLTPQRAAATTAMATATTLIQFPVGLVAQALSVAVLPTLAEHAREGNTDRFKDTLLLGIRLGLLLMIPAMTGLLVLRTPIVYVIFAHHNYRLADANLSALALQNYAYQLPFVAIDQLLIAAFYARKNTRTPVIIGIVSMLFYLAVALPFYSTIGVAALAFANTVQNSSHAIILLILLRISIGSLHIRRTIPSVLKICVAAAVMGLVAWGAMTLLDHISFFSLDHLLGQLLTLIVAGGLAVGVYLGGILLFKVEEINLVKRAVLARLGKK